MKKSSLTIFTLVIILYSCTTPSSHNIVVNIPDIGDDTIIVENIPLSSMDDEPIFDTVNSIDGKFSYDLPNDAASIVVMTPQKLQYLRKSGHPYRPGHRSIFLVTQPGDRMEISGSVSNGLLDYVVVGSELNHAHAENRKKYQQPQIDKARIELTIDSLQHVGGDPKEIDHLFRERGRLSEIINHKNLDFIKENPQSELSALYLVLQPREIFTTYLEVLRGDAIGGVFSSILDEKKYQLEAYELVQADMENIQVGANAPSFKLISIDNKEYSFKPIEGKYLILDFWGSWCAPCIAGFPKMKAYVEKYKDKIEIVGISCNDVKSKWEETVKKHKLGWTNLFNVDDDLEKDVSVMYAIDTYPTKIIIDSNGVIVDIFKGEGEDFYNRLDELMENS